MTKGQSCIELVGVRCVFFIFVLGSDRVCPGDEIARQDELPGLRGYQSLPGEIGATPSVFWTSVQQAYQ